MLEISAEKRFLRLKDVMARTGLSRSSIYLGISKGTFPPNISLGARSVGWIDSEIDAWIQARIDQRSST